MPPSAALTSPEYVSLAKRNDQSPYALVYEPQTVVGTATVASTPQSAPITQILISGASMGWTNQRKDQLVIITDSGGTTIRGYYRNAQVGDVNNLFIDENDFADTGIIALRNRTDLIQAGDIVTICECYPIFTVKPAQEAAGNILQDGYRVVGTNNTLPDDASYNVTINGQPGDYGCKVALAGTKAIVAALTVTPWFTSLGASYTYAWSYPASATSVSGASTATLHLTLPVGSHHIYCDVTDSITSRVFTIVRWIRICDPSDPPLLCNITAAPGDRNTQRVSVRLAQGRIASIPPLAKCLVISTGTTSAGLNWGGDDVPSAAHSYCGWLYQQPYKHSSAWYESSAELVGVAGILDMLQAFALTLQYSASPATWQDLPRELCTVQFVEWWIARNRIANLLNQFNHTPLNTSPTTGFRNLFAIPGNKSILAQLQKVADMYDGNVGDRSDGELIVAPVPSLLVDRTGLVRRAVLDNTIYSDIEVTWVRRNVVGLVTWGGYAAQGTQDIQINAQWPGIKTGQGGKTLTATDKVFDDFSSPGLRVGNAGALANNEFPRITLTIPQNWDIFEPADMQYFDIVVPAAKSPTGVDITIPSVLLSRNPQGFIGLRKSHQLVFEGLTQGSSGIAEVVPSQQANAVGQYSNPITAPLVTPPATFGDANSAVPNTSHGLILATQDGHFVRGSTWSDGSPTDGQRASIVNVIKMIADPWSYKRLLMFGEGGMLICDDATVAAPTWRPVGLLGINNRSSLVVTFDAGGYPYTIVPNSFNPQASVVSGGNPGNCLSGGTVTSTTCTPGNGNTTEATISVVLPAVSTVTAAAMDVKEVSTANNVAWGIDLFDSSNTLLASYSDHSTAASGVWFNVGSGVVSVDNVHHIEFQVSNCDWPSSPLTHYMDNCSVTYQPTSSTETYIADILGSINLLGFFAWLSNKGSYVYMNTTRNYFKSIYSSVLVALYDASVNPGLALSDYGNGAGLATAGDTSITHSAQVRATSGYFTALGAATDINVHSGAVNIPYRQSGGAANSGATPQSIVIKGLAGSTLQCIATDGTTNTVVGSSKVPYGNQSLNTFTLDGNYAAAVMTDGTFLTTDDGGKTWTTRTTVPHGGAFVVGVNGSPQNKDFYIAFGDQCLAISTDRGVTWTDVYSASYDSFRSSAYGSGGTIIVTAMLDLGLIYSKAVTQ